MSSLNKGSKVFYDQIRKHLSDADALADIDEIGLVMMSNDLAMYHNAWDKCDTDGGVQITKTGYSQITGYFTVMEKCKASFLKFSEKFGLSPKDRERMLKFKKPMVEKDDLDNLL